MSGRRSRLISDPLSGLRFGLFSCHISGRMPGLISDHLFDLRFWAYFWPYVRSCVLSDV